MGGRENTHGRNWAALGTFTPSVSPSEDKSEVTALDVFAASPSLARSEHE